MGRFSLVKVCYTVDRCRTVQFVSSYAELFTKILNSAIKNARNVSIEKTLVSALEVLVKFVLLLNSVLLFLCFFHCSSSQMHCALIFYSKSFYSLPSLTLSRHGNCLRNTNFRGCETDFLWRKNCLWGKEIGGMKKRNHWF